jgi:membrane protease YdiL (CAAX protease family)
VTTPIQVEKYGTRPCYGELVAIMLAGLLHIVVELGQSGVAATVYNVAVSIAFLGYLIWRIRREPGVLRVWGIRSDNLIAAALAQLRFFAVAVVALIIFAVVTEAPGLPSTFWFTAALYPVWGIAQQFALQNLIANNITGFFSRPIPIALLAALLFSVSHYPRLELVALTFVGGIFFTLIYRKHPNLWVVGTAHGLLGSMAFYIVLQEDPGAIIIDFLTGS